MRKLLKLLVLLFSVACFVVMGMAPVSEAKTIKVGAAINLTGPASIWGQYHAKGLKDYFRYVNEVKGGIAGNKIALDLEDSAYKIPQALKFVKMFCSESGVAMIATWSAGSGIMAKPIFQKYKVPDINFSTYRGFLKPPVAYAYLPFGTYVMDSYAILQYIKTTYKGDGAPKVGLLTYNNAYGKSIHEPCKEYAKEHHIDIVDIEQFPPTSLNLNTELLRLKKKGAQYIVMQCLPSAIIMAFQSADRVNYKVPFFGTWTSTDPGFFKRGKGLIRDRMFMEFPGCLPGDKNPGMKLLRTLWKRYKSVKKFDMSYWEGVAVGAIMTRAFQKAQSMYGKVDRKTVNKALESFRNEDFGGLIPPVTYTRTNHGGSFTARIIQVHEDQTFTPLTKFWNPKKEKVTVLK